MYTKPDRTPSPPAGKDKEKGKQQREEVKINKRTGKLRGDRRTRAHYVSPTSSCLSRYRGPFRAGGTLCNKGRDIAAESRASSSQPTLWQGCNTSARLLDRSRPRRDWRASSGLREPPVVCRETLLANRRRSTSLTCGIALTPPLVFGAGSEASSSALVGADAPSRIFFCSSQVGTSFASLLGLDGHGWCQAAGSGPGTPSHHQPLLEIPAWQVRTEFEPSSRVLRCQHRLVAAGPAPRVGRMRCAVPGRKVGRWYACRCQDVDSHHTYVHTSYILEALLRSFYNLSTGIFTRPTRGYPSVVYCPCPFPRPAAASNCNATSRSHLWP